MNIYDWSVLPKAHLSPERPMPRAPPTLLTVRDLNVIHPPQRTSSLKASPTVCSDRKKPSQLSESHPSQQSKKANQIAPFSGSILKVAKTRLNTVSALSSHDKENELDRRHDASIHSSVSEDPYWWKGLDLGTSKKDNSNVKNDEVNLSENITLDLNAGSECSSVSRPSTTLSHSTTASASRQPLYRRQSVRRVVTKAFSTLNRKKRSCRSDHTKSVPDPETAWPTSISRSSAYCYKSDLNNLKSSDPEVFIVSDKQCSLSFDEARDVEGSQTALRPSSEPRCYASSNKKPHNRSLNTTLSSEDFGGSNESLLSRSGFQEKPSPQDGDHRLLSQRRDDPTTLRVQLTVKAELKEANLTSEDAIWAVLQIQGEVSKAPSQSSDSDVKASIAVAIVLDNSYLSTKKDIEKAILEINVLAGRLQAHTDRLGIYCTAFSYPAQDEGVDCCVFSMIEPLNREKLSSRLKRIAKQSQHGYHLETALCQAVRALHGLGEASTPAIRRDIIVMSPNPIGLVNYTELLDASFSVHLFNPGLVPFRTLDPLPCLSFHRDSTRPIVQQYESLSLDQDLSYVENLACAGWVIDATTCISLGCSNEFPCLYDVVAHSKAQANIGSITNVSISITPDAEASSIEEIAGKLDYSNLLPGQTISIPIKVRLKSLACRPSSSLSQQWPCLSVTAAIADLEMTLGEHLSELFRVQVCYSHSMFPENTRLVASESCWLRRIHKFQEAREDDSCRQPVFECMVQKQLALSLAGLGPPVDALNALEMEFVSKPISIYCSKFVEAVKRRLRHRIAQSPAQPTAGLSVEIDSYEAELQAFLDEQGQELNMDDSPATVVRRRIAHTPDMELNDTARKIWQHIRKTSKPEREICDEMDANDGNVREHDARMEEIRRMAMRNKRKMSTETLKSLAREYTRFSSELKGVSELGDDID